MRIDIVKTKVYKFSELSDEAREKAIEKLHDINIHCDWYEFVIDDAKEIGKLIGINIDKIYFSGFWSQGDGACFEGNYEYRKGSVKTIIEYAPKDKELQRIAGELQTIQSKHFYKLCAYVKHSGHYYHKMCTNIDIQHANYAHYVPENADEIIEPLRDFMDWMYSWLQKEYEYLTSKEAIIETIEANEYEFTENGIIY